MPLYEYHCEKCGRFEVIRKFSDEPLVVCPTCGGAIEKLLSSPAIQFKGTGWYVTDYAGKTGTGKPGSSKDSTKESGSKESGSKESTSTSDSGGSKTATDSKGSSSSGSSGSGGGGDKS
jgi:putative FmdB family regulatory protein